MKWRITTQPQGRDVNRPNFEKNNGGLVIYLENTESGGRTEVSRVAFDRKESKYPRESFEVRSEKEVAKAVAACKILNTDLMGDGTLL